MLFKKKKVIGGVEYKFKRFYDTCDGEPYEDCHGFLAEDVEVELGGVKCVFEKGFSLSFYANGAICSGRLKHATWFKIDGEDKEFWGGAFIEFKENGCVKKGSMTNGEHYVLQ